MIILRSSLTTAQFHYLMFHWVTGIPFQSDLHAGAYDDLTLWEQIDEGAHYTPAKKWLFTVPIALYVATIDSCILGTRLMHALDFSRQHIIRTTTHGCSQSILLP